MMLVISSNKRVYLQNKIQDQFSFKYLWLYNLLFILLFDNLLLLANPTGLSLKDNENEAELADNYKNERNLWMKNFLKRNKRSTLNGDFYSYSSVLNQNQNNNEQKELTNLNINNNERPCPNGCNCNYDTISCNELIDVCSECINWPQIDFNQITQMKPSSFKNFKFAPNKTTNIIIYKLLDSTIGSYTFQDLNLPKNSQLVITFQYNSMIKFDKNALSGVYLNSNSTLIFYFPYTTQVVFASKCFDGVFMQDNQSKLIIRIIKSYSVRFSNDFYTQSLLYFKTSRTSGSSFSNQTSNNAGNNVAIGKTNSQDSNGQQTTLTNNGANYHKNFMNSYDNAWSLTNGQFIIDIKSTHLVKFEDYSFAYLKLKSNAKFYLDLELVEKLMIQRHSFSNLNLESNSRFIMYAKHITFIDFKAFSFAHISLFSNSMMQIYLEELTSSICVQRNVFSYLRLAEEKSFFNFSIINSKNVMLMHNSFSNIILDNKHTRVYIGVYNSPSYLLKLKANNFYQSFLKERLLYLWSQNALNTNNYNQYSGHFVPPFPINSEYFYNQHTINNDFNSIGLNNRPFGYNSDLNKLDLKSFYQQNKQSYSYNVSIEKNCFSNLNLNFDTNPNENNQNIWIVADNINTLLIDNFIVNYSSNESAVEKSNKRPMFINRNNLNFLLNVKHFALNQNSLQYLKNVRIEYLREPRVFKFGLAPLINKEITRRIDIIGLNLNIGIKSTASINSFNYANTLNKTNELNKFIDNDYNSNYGDNSEQDNVDSSNENGKLLENVYEGRSIITSIDDYCQLAFVSESDTIINVESRKNLNSPTETCSCQSIYLALNRLEKLQNLNSVLNSNILNCKLNEFEMIANCRKQLSEKCERKFDSIHRSASSDGSPQYAINLTDNLQNDEYEANFLKNYVKFWEYCISEVDPLLKGNYYSNGANNNLNYNSNNNNGLDLANFYNNFNDVDGIFSASLSSSSLDQSIDLFNSSSSLSSSSSQATTSNGNASNNGKIIGIIIVSFVCGIILFMIAINIIQYKFRNDLLDDLECSSQQNNTNNNGNNSNGNGSNLNGGGNGTNGSVNHDNGNCENLNENQNLQSRSNSTSQQIKFWKQTFSVNSLKRTFSTASLRRSKRDITKNSSNSDESSGIKDPRMMDEYEYNNNNEDEDEEDENEIDEGNDESQSLNSDEITNGHTDLLNECGEHAEIDEDCANYGRIISNRRKETDSFFNDDENSLCQETSSSKKKQPTKKSNKMYNRRDEVELKISSSSSSSSTTNNSNNNKILLTKNNAINISQDKLTSDSGKSSGSVTISDRMVTPPPPYELTNEKTSHKNKSLLLKPNVNVKIVDKNLNKIQKENDIY